MDIRIEPLDEPHLAAVAALMVQPGVCWGTLGHPFRSPERLRQALAKGSEELLDLVARRDDEVIGFAVVTPNRWRRMHVGRVMIVVADAHVGQGIGTALLAAVVDTADRWLDLRRLELDVYVDNLPAIALYEKFGFLREGLQRQFAFRDGGWVDALAMARCR